MNDLTPIGERNKRIQELEAENETLKALRDELFERNRTEIDRANTLQIQRDAERGQVKRLEAELAESNDLLKEISKIKPEIEDPESLLGWITIIKEKAELYDKFVANK